MDEDKINKTLEILLQNQAQFYANLQEIQQIQKESEKRIGVLERASVNLFNALTKTNENVDKLVESQKETDERFRVTDERLRETDERLNAVIIMVEKFLSSQNGNSEKK
jgi:hypothetical protein